MTPFPAPNRLHVWWARRPLVASRAAVLASILPADADRSQFLHAIGVHGDPMAARQRIALADRKGERLGKDAYGYPRAFGWSPDADDRAWLRRNGLTESLSVLDPTAGGGSIPLETVRVGASSFSNDLNPVAAIIEKATIEYPLLHGTALAEAFSILGKDFVGRVKLRLKGVFPDEVDKDTRPDGYLWARTIRCPYCDGIVPLSPSWRLALDGTGVKLLPRIGAGDGDASRRCDFTIVTKAADQSPSTIADGDGTCPFPDCGRVIDGDEIKSQAQAGRMGEQLYAVVVKRKIETRTKAGGRGRDKWERYYRAPTSEDDNSADILKRLNGKLEEWEAQDFVPNEDIGELSNYDRGHRMYGMRRWRDMFSPRQLLCHGTSVEVYRELLAERQESGGLDEVTKAAFVYLALGIDKMVDYNARASYWDVNTLRVRHVFGRHDFAMVWSFAEMAAMVQGLGYEWMIGAIAECIDELVGMMHPDEGIVRDLLSPKQSNRQSHGSVKITSKSADQLDHINDSSVDVIVMDPPYYDNVMYAELSDFFYVWLKRTAGIVVPEYFTRQLTDKDNEAIANPAKFKSEKGAKALAGRDYQQRMGRIFDECRRVLKSNGIMTLMFTHKATGAWDALTKALMESGFVITASWPINTESGGGLHIKGKSAANSTIFLVCRPRSGSTSGTSAYYWEDIEPLVARAVRTRVAEFQQAGIGGVDLYLASFGPALEEFSRHWPLKRGTPRPKPDFLRKRRQAEMFEEEWDPYAVTPEDALDAARREVKRWRLEQLTHIKANEELDPLTSFFVLAWDAYRAPVFPYDEALRLSRAVGLDLDAQVVGVLVEKKGSNVLMWDSARRAAKGALGAPDGSRGMIDAIHHAAHVGRTRTLQAAQELITKTGVSREQSFFTALEAVLEVLPVGKAFSGVDLAGELAAAANDFESLENLRKLAFTEQVASPKQLELWQPTTAA